jgi:hypothetical protein
MREFALLYLASILAGFALLNVPEVSFLSALTPVFDFVGALGMIVFSLALLYSGVKGLFGKM